MPNSKIKFLNTLFTQKDFYFLNSLDKELSLITKQIKNQEKKRNVINEAIQQFNQNLNSINKDNIENVSSLLQELESSFTLVNTDINSLLKLKEMLNNINKDTVNLLVSIESSPNSKDAYIKQVDELKDYILEYSVYSDTVKPKIANNDLTLNNFLNSDRFHYIYNDFKYKPTAMPEDKNTRSKSNKKYDTLSTDNSNKGKYNNNTLRVCERENKVYLPYNDKEINSYLTQFSSDYTSAEDVIRKEFVLPLDYYIKFPVLSRFRETYSLIRDRESKSIVESLKYSINLMFTYELNPTIIAACKTQEQLESYLDCMQNNKLDDFKYFEIKFEISPR